MTTPDLAVWFPTLRAVPGIHVPQTLTVTTDADLVAILDGEYPDGFDFFLDALKAAAETIGFPCFLRTGYGSGKHDWNRTCFVTSALTLPSHVGFLIEWSNTVGLVGLPTDVWAVREFLDLVTGFTAFNGLPVNKERRYFIKDGNVICHHPYWPPDSIKRPSLPEDEAREILEDLNEEPDREVVFLHRESKKVASHFEGYWSLDWAQTVDGTWYAIDMAPGERSFHWDGCPAKENS